MTELNLEIVKEIVAEMEKTMKALEEKHGVKIERSKPIKFNEVEMDIAFKVVNDQEKVNEKERKDFENWAEFYGLNPAGFGQTMTIGEITAKVVGYNTRAKKFPLMLEDKDGKTYKGSMSTYSKHFPNN